MIGSLRAAMLKKDVPLLLSTSFESLVEKDSQVVGVNLSHNGRQMQIRARRRVVLACGGFESGQAMREHYLPKLTVGTWTAAPSISHGDSIRAGMTLDANFKFMNLTWGKLTGSVPGASSQLSLFMERSFRDAS